MMKYFLDFNAMDQDKFELKTIEEHDTVCEGRLSQIEGADADWQDALDRYFETQYNIKPTEWEVG